jgi:hypothetical protein
VEEGWTLALSGCGGLYVFPVHALLYPQSQASHFSMYRMMQLLNKGIGNAIPVRALNGRRTTRTKFVKSLADAGHSKRGCTEHFTETAFEALKNALGNRCVGCWRTGADLKALGRMLIPDHIVSLANGGLDDITNIQPLCQGSDGCNNKKHAKYLDYLVAY